MKHLEKLTVLPDQQPFTWEKIEGPPIPAEPMPGDRWLLASALQKAIRRAEEERAASAAFSFWQQDRQAFWRRLHIIALEDVGVGDVDALVQVLAITANPVQRRKVGDLQAGLFMVQLLCRAVKCRMADELFIQAERDRTYDEFRIHLARQSDDLLAEYVADTTCPIIERAQALWLLAGTKKYPSEVMPERKGRPEAAVTALRALDIPTPLTEACISVMNRTPWPLAIFTPLIYQYVQQLGKAGTTVKSESIPPAPDVEGIPHYAADMFTRTGGACYRKLQRAVPELKRYSTKQIGLAMFYLEGGKVDRLLTSPDLEAFRDQGELTDVFTTGLCLPEYLGLRDCLTANMDVLADIRQYRLQRYLEGAA